MNLLVCGVGGQGVILFSDIIAHLALTAGWDVKKSEVHGMAQRGGSVTSHIRWGKRVYSPLIEEGTADIVVAFEGLEALRYLPFLSQDGILIYDPIRIEPLPVQIGLIASFPEKTVQERIELRTSRNRAIPAFATACQLGNPRVQNTVMLGAVSKLLGFPLALYHQVFKSLIKPEFLEINLKAFQTGIGLLSNFEPR